MTHPYEIYEGSQLWDEIDAAIRTLVSNGDIELTTKPEYVVGYLCKQISALDTAQKDDN